jgi:phosphatidylserine decarboxylase
MADPSVQSPIGSGGGSGAVFRERLVDAVARDAWVLGAVPLALAGAAGLAGWTALGGLCLALTLFVAFFFRNPPREIPGDEHTVVSPADGRVLEAGEIELEDGRKALRIAIFLSIFDVHVNRAPVAGRVLAKERSGDQYLAAYRKAAERRNARCAMTLETAGGARVDVVQITGVIARRIVCQPAVGEWLERGVRYGMIRFGSRTDVVLPAGSEARVAVGDRVRAGSSVIAALAGDLT